MRRIWVVAACVTMAMLVQPVDAANQLHRPKTRPEPAKSAPPPVPALVAPEGLPPPYDPQLLRLSELMGALTYLRDLCHIDDGLIWRAKMESVIDAEATSPARKEKLAGAFNRGFRGYEITYRSCTPNAVAIITRYLDEGTRLTREISSRYNGG